MLAAATPATSNFPTLTWPRARARNNRFAFSELFEKTRNHARFAAGVSRGAMLLRLSSGVFRSTLAQQSSGWPQPRGISTIPENAGPPAPSDALIFRNVATPLV